jgi:CRP-like cAMP-binding protein
MELQARALASAEEHDALASLPRIAGGVPAVGDGAGSAHGTDYGVFADGQLIAGVHLVAMDRLPTHDPRHAHYGTARFPVPATAQAVLTDLRADPDHARGEAILDLTRATFAGFRAAGGEVLFVSSPPYLVGFSEVMGWRRIGAGAETRSGFRLPMALIAGDWAHLEAVRSPLLEVARAHTPNFDLPDWFDRTFPEYCRPANARAQGAVEFMDSMVASWNATAPLLLADLDSDERESLLELAGQLDAETGDLVLRKGDAGRDLYLILDGALEVAGTHRGQRQVLTTLGAGQIFGEGGFLVQTRRSADLIAIVHSRLLVLSPEAFERLSQEQPRIAMKVLRNLCRALCLRIYAGAAQ